MDNSNTIGQVFPGNFKVYRSLIWVTVSKAIFKIYESLTEPMFSLSNILSIVGTNSFNVEVAERIYGRNPVNAFVVCSCTGEHFDYLVDWEKAHDLIMRSNYARADRVVRIIENAVLPLLKKVTPRTLRAFYQYAASVGDLYAEIHLEEQELKQQELKQQELKQQKNLPPTIAGMEPIPVVQTESVQQETKQIYSDKFIGFIRNHDLRSWLSKNKWNQNTMNFAEYYSLYRRHVQYHVDENTFYEAHIHMGGAIVI